MYGRRQWVRSQTSGLAYLICILSCDWSSKPEHEKSTSRDEDVQSRFCILAYDWLIGWEHDLTPSSGERSWLEINISFKDWLKVWWLNATPSTDDQQNWLQTSDWWHKTTDDWSTALVKRWLISPPMLPDVLIGWERLRSETCPTSTIWDLDWVLIEFKALWKAWIDLMTNNSSCDDGKGASKVGCLDI